MAGGQWRPRAPARAAHRSGRPWRRRHRPGRRGIREGGGHDHSGTAPQAGTTSATGNAEVSAIGRHSRSALVALVALVAPNDRAAGRLPFPDRLAHLVGARRVGEDAVRPCSGGDPHHDPVREGARGASDVRTGAPARRCRRTRRSSSAEGMCSSSYACRRAMNAPLHRAGTPNMWHAERKPRVAGTSGRPGWRPGPGPSGALRRTHLFLIRGFVGLPGAGGEGTVCVGAVECRRVSRTGTGIGVLCESARILSVSAAI